MSDGSSSPEQPTPPESPLNRVDPKTGLTTFSPGNRQKYTPGEGRPYGNPQGLDKFVNTAPGGRTTEQPETGTSTENTPASKSPTEEADK